jgi:hypothetical protein
LAGWPTNGPSGALAAVVDFASVFCFLGIVCLPGSREKIGDWHKRTAISPVEATDATTRGCLSPDFSRLPDPILIVFNRLKEMSNRK